MSPPSTPTERGRSAAYSAPGKLILLGEHAVVYGHPALVAAVDLRLTAHLVPADGSAGALEIHSPRLGDGARLTWEDAAIYARGARERWERYSRAPSPEAFAAVRGEDPAHLVKVVLGEVGLAVRDRPTELRDAPAARLEIDSEIPLGSGFGSSAALSVALTAAALRFLGAAVEPKTVESLALEAERRQHGMPSGVDSATVLYGGIVWAERDDDGRLAVAPLAEHAARSPHLARFRVFDTGTPRETTGGVVAAVRSRLAAEPGRIGPVLGRLGALTRRLRAELLGTGGEAAVLVSLVREAEECLEELGVVPPPVRKLVRLIEEAGGAAKISGAGALSSPPDGLGAGSLLVYHPEPERITGAALFGGLRPLSLKLGAAGLRPEEEETT